VEVDINELSPLDLQTLGMGKLQILTLVYLDDGLSCFIGGGMRMTLLSCVQLLEIFGFNTLLLNTFSIVFLNVKGTMHIATVQSDTKLELHAQELCEPYREL